MRSLAEQLMAGPRGRRVCLLAACLADRATSQASARVTATLDPAAETGWFSPGAIRIDPASADRVRTLGAALSEVTEIDDHWVHLAVETTVGEAMYWQEPLGVLASHPELANGLRRIAGIVSRALSARWWTASMNPEQFEVRFLPVDHVAATGDASAVTLERARTKAIETEARAGSAPQMHPRDASSGTWWSVPSFGLVTTSSAPSGGVPSGLYLVEDGYGQTRASVHGAHAGACRIAEIDSASAWSRLCREVPLDVSASMRGCWYRTTGLADTRWVMPDWAAVAQEYDAVHLQVGAYLAASGTAIEVEPGVHSVIAGWAPGDTFWLTDVVEVEPRGRIFVKDQGDDLWHAEEE